MSVALVTGASRGLGLAITEQLVAHSYQVVVDGRNADRLWSAASGLGSNVFAIPGDVTDPAHRAELRARIEELEELDLLVNNASILGPSPQPSLADYPLDTLEDVYRTNVVAPLALVQAMLPFLESSYGVIVNVTSDASIEPYEGWGGYGSSKAALDHMSRILGVETPGVRVYGFDPGDMRTEMHQAAFPEENISDRPDPQSVVPAFFRLIEQSPPSGRYRASDLLAAVGS